MLPKLFGTRDQFQFRGRQFFQGWRWEGGFRMIQEHYIHCALYFFYYYIVIYNEIIIQLTTMQNQRQPWAHFSATGWSCLGVMGNSDTWSVLHTYENLTLLLIWQEAQLRRWCEQWGAAVNIDEASLAHPQFISFCVAWFLTDLVWYWSKGLGRGPGVGEPC